MERELAEQLCGWPKASEDPALQIEPHVGLGQALSRSESPR